MRIQDTPRAPGKPRFPFTRPGTPGPAARRGLRTLIRVGLVLLGVAGAGSGAAGAPNPAPPGIPADPATAWLSAPDTSVDGVTLCWFDGKIKWGKVGTLKDGVETAWFKGATPPESTSSKEGPYAFRSERIPAGTISQWDGTASPGDFPIKAGDRLFVYVLLDLKDPPFEVLLQLRANNSYDHRAFWGTVNKITHMEPPLTGPLPAAGKWIRLEVDPSVLKVGEKVKR